MLSPGRTHAFCGARAGEQGANRIGGSVEGGEYGRLEDDRFSGTPLNKASFALHENCCDHSVFSHVMASAGLATPNLFRFATWV